MHDSEWLITYHSEKKEVAGLKAQQAFFVIFFNCCTGSTENIQYEINHSQLDHKMPSVQAIWEVDEQDLRNSKNEVTPKLSH